MWDFPTRNVTDCQHYCILISVSGMIGIWFWMILNQVAGIYGGSLRLILHRYHQISGICILPCSSNIFNLAVSYFSKIKMLAESASTMCSKPAWNYRPPTHAVVGNCITATCNRIIFRQWIFLAHWKTKTAAVSASTIDCAISQRLALKSLWTASFGSSSCLTSGEPGRSGKDSSSRCNSCRRMWPIERGSNWCV